MARIALVVLIAACARANDNTPLVLASIFAANSTGGNATCAGTPSALLTAQQGLCTPTSLGDVIVLCGGIGGVGDGSVSIFPTGSGCAGAPPAAQPFADAACLTVGATAVSLRCVAADALPLPPVLPPLPAGTAAIISRAAHACEASVGDRIDIAEAGACVALIAIPQNGAALPPLLQPANAGVNVGPSLPAAPGSARVRCTADGLGGAIFVDSGAGCTNDSAPVLFSNGQCLPSPFTRGPAALQAYCSGAPAEAAQPVVASLVLSSACAAAPAPPPAALAAVTASSGACARLLSTNTSARIICDGAAGSTAILQLCDDDACGACTTAVTPAGGVCVAAPPGLGADSFAVTCAAGTLPAAPPAPALGKASLRVWSHAGCGAVDAGAVDLVVSRDACISVPGQSAAFQVRCDGGAGAAGELIVCSDAACGSGSCSVIASFPAEGDAASACVALPASNQSAVVRCGSALVGSAASNAVGAAVSAGALAIAVTAALGGAW